jgi:hypothetical protein
VAPQSVQMSFSDRSMLGIVIVSIFGSFRITFSWQGLVSDQPSPDPLAQT